MPSPTQRALALCKKRGWFPWIVEKFNSFSKTRLDAYNMFDIIVMDDEQGLIGVQVTSGSNTSARIKKMYDNEYLSEWLKRGLRAEVWSFRKLKKKRGGKATYYKLRRVIILPDGPKEVDDEES